MTDEYGMRRDPTEARRHRARCGIYEVWFDLRHLERDVSDGLDFAEARKRLSALQLELDEVRLMLSEGDVVGTREES